MKLLLIDGEYLKNNGVSNNDLREFLKKEFGKLFYPDKIIYYTANMDSPEKENLETSIINLKVNNKGYLQKDKEKNISHQKAVDGYIIADLTEASLTGLVKNVYLIAGDGDLKAGVEKIYEHKKIRVELIGYKGTISPHLEELCNVHLLDENNEVIKKENDEKISIILNSNKTNKFMEHLKNMFEGEKKELLRSSDIGRMSKKYSLTYGKGELNKILKSLAEKNFITLSKIKGTTDYEISIIKNN
ncbi:MAG: NYN domain-containing protein [Fusobacterium sp.]|nr:NYN domain-containing protein [Fusobacterium sp.]